MLNLTTKSVFEIPKVRDLSNLRIEYIEQNKPENDWNEMETKAPFCFKSKLFVRQVMP